MTAWLRTGFLSILVFTTLSATAQKTIQGVVVDAVTGQPVGSANAYLAKTSLGTQTNGQGVFIINGVPPGKYELIVSCVGYGIYRMDVAPGTTVTNLRISLQPKVTELQEVVLRNSEKFGWEKWGSFFMENVIGTSMYAEETELLNSDVLRFYFNPKTHLLTATATDRLHIRNNALGYHIWFDLAGFSFDTLTKEFGYQGYPFFEEIKTSRESLKKRWQRSRENTYYGSLMHFYRALYDTTLAQNGFEIRRWGFLTEMEKKRVKKLYTDYLDFIKSDNNAIGANPYRYIENTDSLNYFKLVMANEGGQPMLLDTLITAEEITYRVDANSIWLQFRDSLQVKYLHKNFPAEYRRSYHDMRNNVHGAPGKPMQAFSNIYLVADRPVTVYSNGAYANGEVLHISHYFSWSEKLANIVPYDFRPAEILPEHVRKASAPGRAKK